MPGAAPTFPPIDLDALRSAVSTGRPVRVGVLPTGQFPEGTAGRVRAVGTPEVNGPEFIQVELRVGGALDVVPFAPTDLSPLKRGQSAPQPFVRAAPRAAAPRRARRAAGDPADSGAAQTLSLVPPVAPTSASPTPTGAAPTSASSAPTGAAPTGASPTPTVPVAAGPTVAAAGPRRPADRAKRQQITLTLATTEPDHTGWTVTVTVGSRTAVRPAPINPAQAWTVITGLGHPEVEKLVGGALADHRRQAQDRANRLARELAQAQAELAGYPNL